LAELQVGKKVVVKGPASFALWPGQMARVVEGHRLASSQYLVVRVYDAALAQKDPAAVLGVDVAGDDVVFEVGQKFVVQGDRTGFYMPPNGVEVVADDQGSLIREAVTLQRLEYCVLKGETGKKRIVRGEAVVFPQPDESFLDEDGRRRFRALELSSTTGLHIKVIAPYVDDAGAAHSEGDELFLTGATTRLYFPRDEHAIVRTAHGGELHHAVAIPAGEGRYVLDKKTGDVRLIEGPRMLLADPRDEVIVRRLLSDRECMLMFPGNAEALQVNRLGRGAVGRTTTADVESTSTSQAASAAASQKRVKPEATSEGIDTFARAFQKPTALLLDTKYDGAVSVDVWSGYAICVKDRRGQRRVVQGPQSVLLAFDETLEALALSTGTPKTSTKLLSTVFLKMQGNQVSDVVDVATADLVDARVHVTYRVSFEGDAARWFVVDNYVKLLCEHAASMIKGKVRKTSIRALRNEVVELVRDAILGDKTEAGRKGLVFAENGMRVFDVEVHSVDVVDDGVRELLDAAQKESVRAAVVVAQKTANLDDKRRLEEITRQLLAEDETTKLLQKRIEGELEDATQGLERRRMEHRRALLDEKAAAELAATKADAELRALRLLARQHETNEELRELTERQRLELAALAAQTQARVQQAQALSPELGAALTRLGDAQLLSALSENFGELAAVEGKGLLETARKFLDFAPSTTFPQLRQRPAAEADAE
jgi:major vault protein